MLLARFEPGGLIELWTVTIVLRLRRLSRTRPTTERRHAA
jgi:hypothetical protein